MASGNVVSVSFNVGRRRASSYVLDVCDPVTVTSSSQRVFILGGQRAAVRVLPSVRGNYLLSPTFSFNLQISYCGKFCSEYLCIGASFSDSASLFHADLAIGLCS